MLTLKGVIGAAKITWPTMVIQTPIMFRMKTTTVPFKDYDQQQTTPYQRTYLGGGL